MGMRSLKRSIARARMERAGVGRINKRRIWDKEMGKKHEGGWRSYFAMNWRKYIDPATQEYRWAMRGLTGKKKRIRARA